MNDIIFLPNFLKPKKRHDLLRIGKENDGGYIVSQKDVKETESLISLGISFDWSFEKDFLKLNNEISIRTYDGSVGFKYFLKSTKTRFKNFILNPSKISLLKLKQRFVITLDFLLFFRLNFTNKIKHIEKFVTKNYNNFNNFEKDYGYKPKFIDFTSIVNSFSDKVFLSVDIEGDEYELLDTIVTNSKKLVGLNIEFHKVDENLDKIKNFINNLKLDLIHTHINNFGPILNEIPTVIELSFSKFENQDENPSHEFTSELPISLDQPNNLFAKDYLVRFKDF